MSRVEAPLLDIRAVTIVLVGGRMTLADGTQIDSRQSAPEAATAKAVRSAITSSAEWWDAVSSVVVPTLEAEGSGFTLVVGARTLTRVSADGAVHRSSLKRRLVGGAGIISIERSGINRPLPPDHRRIATLRNWQGAHMGDVGFRADGGTPRWRVLHGSDFYLRVLAWRLGASAVVDASGAFLANAFVADLGSLCVEFADDPLCIPPRVIIVPDTPEVRARADRLLAGRVVEPSGSETSVPEYDPAAPRNPDDFLRLGVLRAECNVSGVLRDGRWDDGADLEAARMLLLRRFDLKLGLWDLALNPVLRSTVLDPSPPTTAPNTPIVAPVRAREHARRDAGKATAKREATRGGVRQVVNALHKELRSVGWRVDDREGLSRPLTEPLSNWPDSPKGPLVVLRAEVTKRVVRVLVWHWFYNDLDLNAFVESRREAFDAVAVLPPGAARDPASVTLWSADTGWGDAEADWQDIGRAIAERTKQWEALLADFVTSCRDVRRARFARTRS